MLRSALLLCAELTGDETAEVAEACAAAAAQRWPTRWLRRSDGVAAAALRAAAGGARVDADGSTAAALRAAAAAAHDELAAALAAQADEARAAHGASLARAANCAVARSGWRACRSNACLYCLEIASVCLT